jgi:hypothetical protein
MIKNAVHIIVSLFLIQGVCNAQNWLSLNFKTEWLTPQVNSLTNFKDSILIVNGDFIHLEDSVLANGLAFHQNGQWHGWPILGQNYHPQSSVCTPPDWVDTYNGELIFVSTDYVPDTTGIDPPWGPFHQIRTFDGVSFDTIGRVTNQAFTKLKIINGNLFAFGWFGKIGGIECRGLARYNGTAWDCLDPPFGFTGAPKISDIYLFDNKLWVGGNFSNDDDQPFNEIAYLDLTDSTWHDLDSGIRQDVWARIDVFQEYKGELYIGGVFRYDMGNAGHMIMRWNPQTQKFSDVGGGIFGENYAYSSLAQVQDMIVFEDELWVSGLFDWAGGIYHPSIAVWDGTNWCTFGDSIETRVWDMEIFQDELYILSDFINGDTINKVAKWVGGDFRDTCGTFPLWPHSVNDDKYEKDNVSIYPNPFTERVYVQLAEGNTKVNYSLLDIAGKLVAKGTVNQNQGIDFSQLNAGAYLLQIEGEQTQTFKVIKQ